jgi:hypothetical protein
MKWCSCRGTKQAECWSGGIYWLGLMGELSVRSELLQGLLSKCMCSRILGTGLSLGRCEFLRDAVWRHFRKRRLPLVLHMQNPCSCVGIEASTDGIG